MRIFISWSGPRSKKVADYLNDWLRKLPMPIEPWVSGAAIEPGTRWNKELPEALEGTNFGILCLTSENQDEPWICFEGGALSKAIGKSRVVPYLISMQPSELKHPLQQFHAVEGNKKGTWKMINAIYKATGDQTRSEKDIREVFDKWWPDLEKMIQDAVNEVPMPKPKQLGLEEIQATLERIGTVVESLSSRFSQVEQSLTSGAQGYGVPVVTHGGIPVLSYSLAGSQGCNILVPEKNREPTSPDFVLELSGDSALVSQFINKVEANFSPYISELRKLRVVGNKTLLECKLQHRPPELASTLKDWAKMYGIKMRSILRGTALEPREEFSTT